MASLTARVGAAGGSTSPKRRLRRDDEAIAGEAAPPREEQELLDELVALVRAAESLPQIINALFFEELEG